MKVICEFAHVYPAICDQCMFGQKVEIDGKFYPAKKATKFLTNCPGVYRALSVRCKPGLHKHGQLNNFNADKCKAYPKRLVLAFLKGLSEQLRDDKIAARKHTRANPAIQRRYPDVLSVADSYIVDTGCGNDLISSDGRTMA